MATKHIIIIHGRASKPSGSKKQELIMKSFLHGLGRVDEKAANAVKKGKVKCSVVYYGDINNQLLIAAGAKTKKEFPGKNDPEYGNAPCEAPDSYDADLDRLLARSTDAFGKKDYQKLLADHKDRRWLNEAASVTSAVASLFGLNDEIVAKATPDMGAYLQSRKVGSEVRERLAVPLKPALLEGEDICLVSHSMGCIVSYDVLWKYSQMSEYRDVQNSGNRVSLWLTLGCPLGEPGVKKRLYDANEPTDGIYPRNIIQNWVNVAAYDDFVSHDSKIVDDFGEMRSRGWLRSIKDQRIYNFWTGADGTNPHKFYGYLDHPDVATQISAWMSS